MAQIFANGVLVSSVVIDASQIVNSGSYYEHITITSGSAGSYTVAATDTVIYATSGTGLTLNLPVSTGSGRKLLIIQADAGTGITITPNGVQTIEGAATKATTTQYQKCGLIDVVAGTWSDLGTGGV